MEKKGNPNMELKQLTGRIWYYPYEQERDRPNLIYIRGDRWSLAVDAGHSDAHIAEFYSALEEAGFPLIPVLAAAGAAIVIALITAIVVRRKKKAVSPEADLPEDWFKDEPKK